MSLLGSIASGLENSGRDFYDLVKAIGESKSKQEEDRIIAEEIVYLKRTLPAGGHSAKKLKELVVRSLYVEMLGQDGSFAYMRIVELCASSNITYKKAGYLAASLTLHPGHEFRLMLVNRMQQDMKSTNMIESTTALSGVCRLVTEDMVPAVVGEVIKLLNHEMDAVRKKAVSALHRLYQLDKTCIDDHHDKLRRVICDKDPAVMGASLGFLLDLARDDVSSWKDLVPSLVSILKQIIEHRLAKEFDYHRIPAPWLQMNLLRLLAVLGRGDQTASEDMYEVLAEVMKRADTGINVGYAIVFEAVSTVTTIYPNTVLLDSAATSISRFIRSDSHNLKYIGVKGLAAIVKDHPRYAADHQMAVVDCLEDTDETLKRKTLSLLFRMTNSVNVEFIIKKLLHSLEFATDDHFRTELVSQIVQCAERYAPTNAWFIRTMLRVFELAGEKVTSTIAQTFIQIIAEGSDEDADDEPDDDDLRAEAVASFLQLMLKPKLPELIVQTLCWVLGEYGYLSRTSNMENIVDNLCALAASTGDSITRACVVSAVMKLVAQMGHCPAKALEIVQDFETSMSVDVHQRCTIFNKLLKHPGIMVDVLPVDASCEDIEVDESMSFLNNHVSNALANGAAPYSMPSHLNMNEDVQIEIGLNITPYEKPTAPVLPPTGGIMGMSSDMGSIGAAATSSAAPVSPQNMQGNTLLGGSKLGGGGGPWSRTMEAPKHVPVQLTPAQRQQQEVQRLEAERKEKESKQQSMPASASVVTPAAMVVSNEPEKPREPTEKEKMAAGLFGGFGSSASVPKPGISRRARGAAASPSVPTSTVQDEASRSSLLDMGDDIILSADTPSATPTISGGNMFDMDDLSLLGGADVPANVTPPVPPALGAEDDLLFSGMTLGGDAAPPLAPTVSSTTPLQLTTPEFGAKWGSCAIEVKEQVAPCEIPSLPHLKSVLESCGRYAHVESIGATKEAIFASSAGDGSTILVHVKLLECDAAEVTVRSTSNSISSVEFSFLDNLIKNS